MGELTDSIKAPPTKITFFRNGRVATITEYWTLNGGAIGGQTYRRWGERYFRSRFSKLRGTYVKKSDIDPHRIPQEARDIFAADTIENVRQLARERGRYDYTFAID